MGREIERRKIGWVREKEKEPGRAKAREELQFDVCGNQNLFVLKAVSAAHLTDGDLKIIVL